MLECLAEDCDISICLSRFESLKCSCEVEWAISCPLVPEVNVLFILGWKNLKWG